MANNIPLENALDLNLINYAYGTDVLPGGFFLVKPINEPGPNRTIEIDILQNASTGKYYVVPRGTANAQNGATDLQLANDPVLIRAIEKAANYMLTNIDPNASIEFVGHSLAEYPAVMLASQWTNFAGNQNITVHSYDGAGIPSANLTSQMTADLTSVTTNYRLVLPGTQPTLSNGMTVGDIVSPLNNHLGTVVEVPAAAGTFSNVLDLHSTGAPLAQADWSSARIISTNGISGIGIDPLLDDMPSIAQIFDISQGQVDLAGQVANLSRVLGAEAVKVGTYLKNGTNNDLVVAFRSFASGLRTTNDAVWDQVNTGTPSDVTARQRWITALSQNLADDATDGFLLKGIGEIALEVSAAAKMGQNASSFWEDVKNALAAGTLLERAMAQAVWDTYQGIARSFQSTDVDAAAAEQDANRAYIDGFSSVFPAGSIVTTVKRQATGGSIFSNDLGNGNSFEATFDAVGNLLTMDITNTIADSQTGDTTLQTYRHNSAGGSIIDEIGYNPSSSGTLTVFSYDANGNAIATNLGTFAAPGASGSIIWDGSELLVPLYDTAVGQFDRLYVVGPGGSLVAKSYTFSGPSTLPTFNESVSGVIAAEQELSSIISITAPPASTPINNSWLSVAVQQLSLVQAQYQNGDTFGSVLNNQIAGSAGSIVSMPGQAVSNDLAATWSTAIGSGNYQPGWQRLLDPTSDITRQTAILNYLDPNQAVIDALSVNYMATNGLTVTNVDPLLIDLAGGGIGVSNWISNTVYFDTGVKNDGSGAPDGLQHHTSWAQVGTGILALDLNHDGKVNDITETLSQFFRGGPTAGRYADGLAALAALSRTGATVFNASTSLTDAATGQSYWSELVVWNDANQDGVTDAGELETLSQLGVTSIGLLGSGNLGEAINGSAVTNRTTYTKSDGSSGEVAAVDFQADAVGAITVSANGGVMISSLTEGGPTLTSTFVAQNATGHSYLVSGGRLTDQTTGAVISTDIDAVLSSNQNDVISVDANDTGTYWLGGGSGADTLTGGGGTNVFLVNGNTVVHGGTGPNSFNIAKVIGTQGITIDLAAAHLNEVVGGVGGDVINASGTTWNVFIQGGEGNNIIIGGAATAAISGGKGDDLIMAGPGGSVIHAGLGNAIIYGGSGASVATQPNYVNAGASSNAAFVERLYNGGLGREADLAGYQSWLNQLNSGTKSRTDVATGFVASSEWQAHYGTQTNTQFVTSIFTNLVGRAPSSSELNQFVQALDAGQTRGVALETVADAAQSQTYWGSRHPGASDVIYAGPGHDVIKLGTNNSEIYVGSGALTVIGNPNGFSVVGFHGSYADYTFTHNADGTITVTNNNNMDGDGAVTMKDVTALDFKDISQVTIAGAAGMPASDYLYTADTTKVQTNASGQYVIAAATLLANDLDYAGKALSIRELVDNNGAAIARGASGQVNGGTVALSTDGATITFVPTAGYNGVPSFRYHVQDSSGAQGAIVQQLGTTNTAEMTATVYLNTPNLPTDPLFDSEWFLQAANVLPVWKDYTGAGVKIGVFDPSGNVDFSNPDLASKVGRSVKVDGTPGIDHLGTHATLVAGVIGAARNGSGAVGVAYDATIGSEAIGSGTNANVGNIADWVNYDVVNNSWASTVLFQDNYITNSAFGTLVHNAAANGRGGLGTAIVFGGGNSRAAGDNTNYHNESNSRYAIVVGGINAPSNLGSLQISGAPFSNPGASLLVSAPANNITSTGITWTNQFGQQFGADYQTTAGTSFATPIVSGVIALMLQANPTLGYRDIQQILAYSAVKVDPSNVTWSFNGANNWNGGGLHTSEDYGFGEVDAHAAVRLAATWQTQNTAANEQSVNSHAGVFSTSTGAATSLNYAIPVDSGASTPTINLTFPTTPASQVRVEHVDIELNLVGVRASDLIVKLIAPSGETSILANRPENTTGQQGTDAPQNLDFTFDTVKDWGEFSGGTWKLEVAYAAGTTPIGTLAGVNATIYGALVTTTNTFIYTDEYAQVAGGARSTLHDPSSTYDTLNLAATTGTVNLDLRPGSTSGTIDGQSFALGTDTHVSQVFLGDGDATVTGNSFDNFFIAGTGNATIHGGTAHNTFYAGGSRYLPTPRGVDTFYGAGLANNFFLGSGIAHITGGAAGDNVLDFVYAPSGVSVNLATGVNGGAATGDTFTNIQGIVGSSYDDTIGAWGGKTLDGGLGTNTLDYSAASAPVTIGFYNDTAQVGALAQDTISNFQRVIGSSGDDFIIDGPTLSYVDGGAGINTLDLSIDPAGVSIDLSAGTGTTGYGNPITIKNIRYLYGSSYASNVITGAADTLGVTGSLYGGDTITANSSQTAVSFYNSRSGVNVNLATNVNTGGAAQGDSLYNVHALVGSPYNDSLTGTSVSEQFDGDAGNDTIAGGGGYDYYYFGTYAGYGHDTIINGIASSNYASGELDVGYAGLNDVLPTNIWLKHVGNDLEVDIMGTNSSVTMKDWYSHTYSQVAHIVASDGETLDTGLNDLVAAMSQYSTAHPTFDPHNPANASITDSTLLAAVLRDWAVPAGSMALMSTSTATTSDSLSTGIASPQTYGQSPLVNALHSAPQYAA